MIVNDNICPGNIFRHKKSGSFCFRQIGVSVGVDLIKEPILKDELMKTPGFPT
ncbi:hypothetical protein FC56_GL001119 [Lentilactobacillus senioris DSM 24302 = JCM 17472]|uniref:Uncharacterized protein n=1 Tax=Lentilactobacillus senioris DSM 24302 = JCM 17472 TaxID=1423802 RepID=A0A0R2D237_9LACO|nr:hypothetical protein FC56_GL001119 [Lentilactobacillus senioris DSM 24302 = JCM 17472]